MKLYFYESEINLNQFKDITYEEREWKEFQSYVYSDAWIDYANSRGRNVTIKDGSVYWEEEFIKRYLLIDGLENFIFDICRNGDPICFYREEDRLYIKECYEGE